MPTGFGLRPGTKAPDEPPSPTGHAPPLDSTRYGHAAGPTGRWRCRRPAPVDVPCARRAPGPDRLAVRRCLSDYRTPDTGLTERLPVDPWTRGPVDVSVRPCRYGGPATGRSTREAAERRKSADELKRAEPGSAPCGEERTPPAGRVGQSARIPPDADGASGWASRVSIPAPPNGYPVDPWTRGPVDPWTPRPWMDPTAGTHGWACPSSPGSRRLRFVWVPPACASAGAQAAVPDPRIATALALGATSP